MIYKPKGSRYYFAKFRWKGRLIRKSTRATNAKDAHSIEGRLRSELARGNWDIVEKKPAPALGEFLKREFLPHVDVQFKAKPRTGQYYHEGAQRLLASSIASLKLDEITDQHARQFEARWELLSPSTINCGLRTLRRVLNLAADWGRMDRRVRITLARGERQRDRVVSEDEFRMYLEKCPALWREVATVLYGTGMRPSECYGLTWPNVHLNGSGGLIAITQGKSKAARRLLPMMPPVYEVLKARYESQGRPTEGCVFGTTSACGHLVQGMAQKYHRAALAALAKARQEDTDLLEVKPFEIYCMRHSFLTRLAESGCDAFTLAKIAGHSSIAITQRYCHPAQDSVDRAFRVMAGSPKVVTDGGHSQKSLPEHGETDLPVTDGEVSR
jgi:integrase